MDNHDIRHQIGQYLDQKAALACIRVSKDWLESFEPFVYQKVKLAFNERRNRTYPDVKMPTLRRFYRYGSYIRHLRLRGNKDTSRDSVGHPVNETDEQDSPPHDHQFLLQFLNSHPKIERLELKKFLHPETVEVFARSCAHLKELRLKEMIMTVEVILELLKGSPRLHTLSINEGFITGAHRDFPEPETTLLQSIRTLEFSGVCGLSLAILLEWMARCPRLESIKIRLGPLTKFPSDPDLSLFSRCPKLTQLTLDRTGFIDTTMARILSGCPNLTELTLRGERVNEKTFNAMKTLFGQLRVLNLFGTTGMKSWMSGVILSDCPNLVDFAVGVVDVDPAGILTSNAPGRIPRPKNRDANYSGPPISSRRWACTRLRRLRFKALKWSNRDAVDDKFLDERLAQLKELEEFQIGGFDEEDDHRETWLLREMYQRMPSHTTPRYGGPLMGGAFKRAELESIPALRWMAETWPKLQRFQNIDYIP
ncbi:hypothetical protein BGZ83_005974 [Gryganskiella cystojenkinii]|nr:hypothetical protein BGZ83_005974 [Gryganskiella cystojenkinii]